MGAGVGLAAGGAAKGFGAGLDESQTLQQGKATAALGAGARLLSGAPAEDQSSSNPLSNLLGGQQQQAASSQGSPSQSAPGVARSLPQVQSAQAPQATPTPQAQPSNPQPRPPMAVPGLSPAQPGIANTGAQQGQPPPSQPQQPPPAQPQAQLRPSSPPPQFQGGQPQMGQWDLPGLTQAILKGRPNISDRDLGSALIQGIPALNAQGLQQFRGAAQQIARERADTGGFNADTARHREQRLSNWDAAKPARERADKEANAVLQTAYRMYGPILNDITAKPEAKKAAQAAIGAAEAKAKEIRDKGYAPPPEDSSGESGDTGLPDEADAIAQAKEALQNKGVDKKAVLERLQQYYPGVTEQDLQ